MELPAMGFRHLKGSLTLLASWFVLAVALGAQQQTVQALLERGALDEAVQRAEHERDNVEATYFAAMAFSRMNNNGRAVEEYTRLRETGDDSWRAIGESGALLAQGDSAGALQAAERAVTANAGNAFAHYQLGAVAQRQGNFAKAAEEFGRAIELKSDFAYAHYYAGLANQRIKNIARMSEHFEAFMRLAPEAPERNAVAAILRTMRPV
jgi:tetratricopeptide (TPR) repeat protein